MWQIRSRSQPVWETSPGKRPGLSVQERRASPAGETRVHVDDPKGREILGKAIASHLASLCPTPSPVTVVCVGSDRSTGDALGPLVGTHLSRIAHPRLLVHGTLENPVHAANLAERLELPPPKRPGRSRRRRRCVPGQI